MDDVERFDDWWVPDLASIRTGSYPGICPVGFVQPAARTLLIGGLNAVLAAQVAHCSLLGSAAVVEGAGDIGGLGGFPRGEVSGGNGWGGSPSQELLSGVYIDGLCSLAVVPWSLLGSFPIAC